MVSKIQQPGDWLRLEMLRAGVSQKRVCEELAIQAPQLNKWLRGKEPIPSEFHPLLTQLLECAPESSEYLSLITNVADWEKRVRARCKSKGFVQQELRDQAGLYEYVLDLVVQLAEADVQHGVNRSREHTYVFHLHSAQVALTSAALTLERKKDKGALELFNEPIFTHETILRHIRYPTNYYLGALMNMSDESVTGGARVSAILRDRVRDAAEESRSRKLVERLLQYHARHMHARYGSDPAEPRLSSRLLHSDEIEERRMYFAGMALRDGSTDADWNALYDQLDKDPAFQAATAVFDAVHYDKHAHDDVAVGGIVARQAALRAMTGLDHPNERLRTFAAKRLKILIQHTSPKSFEGNKIRERVQQIRDRGVGTINLEGRRALDVIENFNKEGQ